MYLSPTNDKDPNIINEINNILELEDVDFINKLIDENYSLERIQKYISERGLDISSHVISMYRYLYLKSKQDNIDIRELMANEFSIAVKNLPFGMKVIEDISDIWSDIDNLNRIIKQGTDIVINTQNISAKDVINAINVKSHILARNNEKLIQYVSELTSMMERIIDILHEELPPELLDRVQKRFEIEFGG